MCRACCRARARPRWRALIGTLNTDVQGAFLFAGINADVKPVADYDQNPPSAAKQAVATAFPAAFGISQSDPAVANISAADMQTFLDTTFADLFADAGVVERLVAGLGSERAQPHLHLRDDRHLHQRQRLDAFRKLASAYTMVADLGTANLNQDAYQKVVDRAISSPATAIQGLTTAQADLGDAQQRVTNANDRMAIQQRHHDHAYRGARERRPVRGLDPAFRPDDAGRDGLRDDGPHPEAHAAQLPLVRAARFNRQTNGRTTMYQFSYAEVLDETPRGARERERQAIDRSIELLEAADKAGVRSREAIEAVLFVRRLWGTLVEDLASPENDLPRTCVPI